VLVGALLVWSVLEAVLRDEFGLLVLTERPDDPAWRPLVLIVSVVIAATLLWRRSHPLGAVAVAFGTIIAFDVARIFLIDAAGLTSVAALAATTLPLRGQAEAPPEEFTAFAIAMGRISTGATATIILNVSRWTSNTERDKLFEALREGGQRAMIEAFRQTTRVGTYRTPHTVGYDLHFAYQEPAPEGRRRIIIATDRPIDFAEAWGSPVAPERRMSSAVMTWIAEAVSVSFSGRRETLVRRAGRSRVGEA
jgi:hypothetical protein